MKKLLTLILFVMPVVSLIIPMAILPSLVQAATSGTPYAWGNNYSFQLGNGDEASPNSPSPVQVSGLSGVVAISAGNHTLALKLDGTVWAWGPNAYGQLGKGDGSTNNSAIPLQVIGLSDVVAIAAGGSHNLVLKSDGTVWSWGWNFTGQLGLGSGSGIMGYNNEGIDTPTNVNVLNNVVAVAALDQQSVALKSDGSVWGWGGYYYNNPTPTQVNGLSGVEAIASGNCHTLALKGGMVWAWGLNNYGQLGIGTYDSSENPVQVNGLSGVVAIAGGANHSLALMPDGTVWAWGMNDYGQLGNGTSTTSPSPVQVSGLSGVVAIASGIIHSMALKNDGTVWAWGYNYFGQLGNGTYINSWIPVQVSGLNNVLAIAGGWDHNVALKAGPQIIPSIQMTQQLMTDVKNLGLPSGAVSSIIPKLDNALQSLQKGNKTAAVNQLKAFINEVKAQRGKKIPLAQADDLIAEAQQIINAVNP
jgi:alpha-tubulin suppressor-like RCC1 family protein